MKIKYLIIGNSVAAANACEAIRSRDLEGTITIVSDEAQANYSRPLISYYLAGRVAEKDLGFKEHDFYEKNKVKLVLKTKAISLDPAKHQVTLENKQKIRYDKLLLSTGGKPILPAISGYDEGMAGVFNFIRLSDAQALVSYIAKNKIKDAVVLGAGLIGLKATEGLLEKGVRVKLVELADRVLASTFDRTASDMLEQKLRAAGCEVYKNNSIEKIVASKGKITAVALKGGQALDTKLLIVAVGVKPNLDLTAKTGIRCDRGIVVDKRLQTSVKDIYAAGDCAQGYDNISNKDQVLAIWPVAARQGKVAGANMAGAEETYAGFFPMNSVQFMDVPTISFGITNPPERDERYEVLVKKDPERCFYRKIVLRDNKVVGVILLNEIDRAGLYSVMIREKIDASKMKVELLSDDFGLLHLPSDLRKNLINGEGIEI